MWWIWTRVFIAEDEGRLLICQIAELAGHFTVWLASAEAAFLKSRFVWVNYDAEELLGRRSEIEDSMLLRVMLEGVPM